MSDEIFKKLLFIKEKKREMKVYIKNIEDSLIPFQQKLAEAEEEEKEIQEKVIASMKKEGVKNKVYDGRQIIQSEKKYVKIIDNEKVLNALSEKYIAPLKRIIGATYEEIRDTLVKPAELDTKKAKEYIDILIKVEGVEQVEGTEIQVTEYITIKS